MMNEVRLQGFLVSDPELKVSPRGTPWLRVDLLYVSARGRRSYFSLAAFDTVAENLATLKKDDIVEVAGELVQDCWKGEDEKNHYAVRIIARDVKFIPDPFTE